MSNRKLIEETTSVTVTRRRVFVDPNPSRPPAREIIDAEAEALPPSKPGLAAGGARVIQMPVRRAG